VAPLSNLVRPVEFAAQIGIERKTLYRLMERHGAPCYKIGRAVYIDPDDFARWIETHRHGD
jgi:excisionase family DNA binding protein